MSQLQPALTSAMVADLTPPPLVQADRRRDAPAGDGVELQPGKVQKHRLHGGPVPHEYYLYVPRTAPDAHRLFVSVHGVSRNAREHLQYFAPFAERHGVVAVAPRFSADRFPDYQRLGRLGRGEQAGLVLQRIADEVGRLTAVDPGRLFLFGYSGGGQFVHRFAMAYPELVVKYAVAAAGWYTFPARERRYPHGIKRSRAQGELRFRPDRFLTIPALVVVGDRDTVQNGKLRESPNVMSHQGTSRVARGQKWVEAMRSAARERGLDTPFEFKLLAASRHLFRQCMKRGGMGQIVFDFLFGPDGVP